MRDLVGHQMGPYEIRDLIAAGGMAVVYRAFQPALNKDVAIKVLRTSLADDPQFVERFRREAMAAAGLRHQNILPVYDAGTFEGRHYIVMDYVPGGTLTQRLAKGALPADEAADLAAQIADALNYAHARPRPVIHRDLKPSNILMDEDGKPLLTDFGIAHVMSSEQHLTQTGTSLGTPEYMSPEQGQALPVDGRTDIYSLGVMLYQMVTGRVPFQANTPIGVMLQHVGQTPPNPHDLNASVPKYMENIILRSLAKHPDDRFATAREMAQALRERRVVEVPATAFRPQEAGATIAYPYDRRGATPPPYVPPPGPPPGAVPGRRRSGRGLAVAVLSLALLAAFIAIGYMLAGDSLRGAIAARPAQTEAPAPPTSAPTDVPTDTPEPPRPTPTSKKGIVVLGAEKPPEPSAISPPAPEATDVPAIPTDTPVVGPSPTVAVAASAPTEAPPTTSAPTSAPTEAPPTTSAPTSAPLPPGVVTDFESFGTWVPGDQKYGTLMQSNARVQSGTYSARLDYQFPAIADNYVVLLHKPRALALPGEPGALSLNVFGDGSGHFLNAWIKDSQGEVRAFPFGRIQHNGAWQTMTAPLDMAAPWPQAHISGPDNGRLDYPISLQALVLDGVPDGGGPFQGTIYLDDLVTAAGGPGPVSQPTPSGGGDAVQPTPTTATAAPPPSGLTGLIAYTANGGQGRGVYVLDVASGNTWLAFAEGRQPDIRGDRRIALNGAGGGRDNLWSVNADGSAARANTNHPEDAYPSWSPSGVSAAFHSSFQGDGVNRIYMAGDMGARAEPNKLLLNGQSVFGRDPTWLENWRIAFTGCDYWGSGSNCGIWSLNSDGSGGPARITEDPNDRSSDDRGGLLLFGRPSGGNWEVFAIADGGGQARNLTNSPNQEWGAAFSPDGRSIAFMSDRGGVWSIWVMNADGSGARRLLDVPGGFGGDWAEEKLSWAP
jgi:Tol biopolymer transport system component/tRNA A-37 threonylcarbamoyl transferase component Bud32